MMKTLLFVLSYSGINVLCIDLFREYHYVNSSKTWAKAQQYCREMNGDLATVSSSEESKRLISVLQKTKEFAWIGLYDNTTSWKWTMGDSDFDITSKDGFPPWQKAQPDNTEGNGSCIVINLHGGWWDFSCEAEHPFICFDENLASKYIVIKTFMVWEDAKNYCQSKHTDLLRVWNTSQNNEIHALIRQYHWIGLYRKLWARWSDRSRVTFTNWEVGQPESTLTSCAAVKTDTGMWWDIDCNEEHEFICQTQILHRRFELRFQSEADLTDPHIQQQILKQLHTKMEAKGLTEFKLRWTEMDGKIFKKEPKTKT